MQAAPCQKNKRCQTVDALPGDNVLTAPSKKRYMQSSANAGCLMTCWDEHDEKGHICPTWRNLVS